MRGDESEAVFVSLTKKPGRILQRLIGYQQLATGNKNVNLDCFILGAYVAIAGGFPYGGCDRAVDCFRCSSTPGPPGRDSINETKNRGFGTNLWLISKIFGQAPAVTHSRTEVLGRPGNRHHPQFPRGVIRTQKRPVPP